MAAPRPPELARSTITEGCSRSGWTEHGARLTRTVALQSVASAAGDAARDVG